MSTNFATHYDAWRTSRINTIKKYIGETYFQNKTLLELGCGYADIGNKFSELGAIVSSTDSREEHLEVVKKRYPHLNIFRLDGDKDTIEQKYDIILHWGLLYHLNEIENHLARLSDKCDILLLETEVLDSDDENEFLTTKEKGYDQAFNNFGIRPSAKYVEKVLAQNDFQYVCIIDPIINANNHTYDWVVKNTKTWRHGLRRFWICWKNVESPLIKV
jgi:hypothetical protein